MTVAKRPEIESLDPRSLCHSIYRELYAQFFNAQDRKDDQHPWGVEEGDDTSIRLHNTAYGFAAAIAGAVEGGGGSEGGGILLDYIKKSGGDMSGILRAKYGFEGGIGNKILLDFYDHEESAGARIPQDIDFRGKVYLGGDEFLDYDRDSKRVTITAGTLSFGNAAITTSGSITFGIRETGVYISPTDLTVKGNAVYHSGNANLETVDWNMKDAVVAGNISITGTTHFNDKLTALYDAEFGYGGVHSLSIGRNGIYATSDLSFASGYGIRISDMLVLGRVNETDIRLGGIGGDLLLGGDNTAKVKLLSNIMDEDGSYTLLSSHGTAYLPDGLTVRHNFGTVLLQSYRKDMYDEGIIIPKKLRFLDERGPFFQGLTDGITLNIDADMWNAGISTWVPANSVSTFKVASSTSLRVPANAFSLSFVIDTNSDFIRLDKPTEVKNYVGIDKSYTRLKDGALFLNDNNYLLSITDGIKHFGNSYMLGDVSSEFFSSGFAGSGWAIHRNKTTGNTTVTIDELTVRKRMRVYELEVQKTSATNGALWISDSFSGDVVEKVS